MSYDYSIIKQLVRQANAHPRPGVLRISDREVEPLACLCHSMTLPEEPLSYIIDMIRAGRMKFYGIPVWVRE